MKTWKSANLVYRCLIPLLAALQLGCLPSKSARQLSLTPVAGKAQPGAIHQYAINLPANQYCRVLIKHLLADLRFTVRDSVGQLLAEVESCERNVTAISFVASTAGKYALEIVSREAEAFVVDYEVTISEQRPTQDTDDSRLAGERAFAAANRLYQTASVDARNLAKAKYREAYRHWQAVGAAAEQALALQSLGVLFQVQGNPRQALEEYTNALPLAQAATETSMEAELLSGIGYAYLYQGEHRTAIERLETALEVSQRLKTPQVEAKILNHLGECHYASGQMNWALELHQRALARFIQLKDRKGQAAALMNVGHALTTLGEFAAAKASFQQAITLWRSVKDRSGEAQTLVGLGHIESRLGRKENALKVYQAAAEVLQDIDDPEWQASILSSKGFAYEGLGQVERSLSLYAEAAKIFQAAGYVYGETGALVQLGRAHLSVDKTSAALDCLQRALALTQTQDSKSNECYVQRNLSAVYEAMKDSKHAFASAERAISVCQLAQELRGAAIAAQSLGKLHEKENRRPQAHTHYQQALAFYRKLEDRYGEGMTLYQIAALERLAGDFSAAEEDIKKAYEIIEKLRAEVLNQGFRASYFASVHQIFELYIDILMQRHFAAPTASFLDKALAMSERARARSLLEMLHDSRQQIQRGAAPNLLEQEHLLLQAFRSKAERKLQVLGNPAKEAELAALHKELDDLATRLDDIRTKLRENNPQYAALTQPQPLQTQEIQPLLDDNTILLEFALGKERSYLWAITKDSLAAVMLPPRATIEKLSSEVYALLTAQQQPQADTTQSQLLRARQADQQYWPKAAALSQLLLGPIANKLGNQRLIIVSEGTLQRIPFAALPEPSVVSRQLSVLGKNVAGSQLSVTNKNAQANRQLATDNPQPLIVNHEIIYLPSASILSVLRKERATPPTPTRLASFMDSFWGIFGKRQTSLPGAMNSIAILADPVFEKEDRRVLAGAKAPAATAQSQTREVDLSDENLRLNRLPETAVEAGEIEKAAGANAFLLKTGFAVNRALLEGEELDRYAIVHFATHGYWDSERPELSGLVLSRYDQQGNKQDGFLRLSDIYNLRMPKELVVLSACETALGKDIRGEGLMALTRGFMYAGASRVMASLWKVEESATVDLMKVFYGKLLRDKLSPAAALREAQIAIWRQDPTSAPYDWAAFVLQGEYR